MNYHAKLDGFENEDLVPDKRIHLPEISAVITRTLARLMAFNDATKTYKLLKADVDGRLLVSTSPTQSSAVVSSQQTVSLVSVVLLNANPSRKQYIIQNLGGNPIFLGFNAPALAASGFSIPSNGVFIDDVYIGALNAIALVAGNDVRIVEM